MKNQQRLRVIPFLIALLFCARLPFANDDRPSSWATELADDQPGLSNLFKVSDVLYRGAQPDDEGFRSLRRLGVKSVVNLRTFHSDRSDCEENNLRYFPITMQAWEEEDAELIEFLRVIDDPENHPVFVHCHHGSDRTGVAIAVYRLVFQNWSKEEAIKEMTEGGYGFHGIWQNLIKYVEELDVERLRAQALEGEVEGIRSSTPSSPVGPIRYVVGSKVSKPRRTGGPEPEYPQAALAANFESVVVLEVTISKTGTVKNVKVLRGLPLGVTEAVVKAVKEWTYSPAMIDGIPVDVLYIETVRFASQTP